jgi:hypothetical protein
MLTFPIRLRLRKTGKDVAKIVGTTLVTLLIVYYLIIPSNHRQQSVNINADGRRIFFHETSGRGNLNFRQCCAIESVAKHNSGRPVQLLISGDRLDDSTGPWMDILKDHYANVAVFLVDNGNYFSGSPLQKWYENGEWRDSRFRTAHLSDYIRLVSLYRHGGLYMDLDYVVLKPLDEKLLHNVLLVEGADGKQLNNGVIHFEPGHRLIKELIQYLAAEYDPEDYYLHGPTALTNVYIRLCSSNNGTAGRIKRKSSVCPDVSLLSYKHFCPIGPPFWHLYFEEASRQSLSMINSSYGVHLWNFLSSNEPIRMGTRQLYAILAAEHCPITANRFNQFIAT